MTIRDRMLLFYTYEEINIMTKNEFFEAVKENVLDILREEDQGFDGDIKKKHLSSLQTSTGSDCKQEREIIGI